jgi:hypothetical protein
MGMSDRTEQGSDGRYLLAASVLFLLLAGGAAWVALETSLATWLRIIAVVFCVLWLLSAWRAYVRASSAKRF